jgi:uncharacterized RDD family membrane protein YckC
MSKYQTFFPRLGALILDAVLLLPLSVLADWIAGTEMDAGVKSAVSISIDFANIFYFIVLHALFGQTVGKMLLKVKVLSVAEERLGWRRAIIRDLPQLIFVAISLIPMVNNDLGVKDVPLTPVGILVAMWGLADIAVFFSTPKHRALHDLIAGSVVVRIDDAGAIEEATT